MAVTYWHYLTYTEIAKYRHAITILRCECMDIGALALFTCNDEQVLDEIFEDE